MELMYDSDAQETLDNDNCVAKCINLKDGSWIFYARKDIRGKLYNPNDILSGKVSSKSRSSGHETYQMKKVKENTFKFYLKFLDTKETKYLVNAEREDI